MSLIGALATVGRWLAMPLQRLRRGMGPEVAAVLAVIVSVQGVVIIGQFFAAFALRPEDLGLIRWLESAFSIALLVSCCGMPTIAFRESALCRTAEERIRLLLCAALVTSLTVCIVLFLGAVLYRGIEKFSMAPGTLMLVAMSGVLLPANVARVGVAVVQGGRLSTAVWGRMLLFSSVAVAVLALSSRLSGVQGWVLARYVTEAGLAALMVHAVAPRNSRFFPLALPQRGVLRGLFWTGTVANSAFVLRAVSDNLPVLLLKEYGAAAPAQLGWYGFASLLIFLPTLILSVLMQARLPLLVQALDSQAAFRDGLVRMQRDLLGGAIAGCLLLLAMAALLHWTPLFANYAPAAGPLLILGCTLPLRAFILTAGAAAVARGKYFASASLAVAEILCVAVGSFMGSGASAVGMSWLVLGASALALLPAFALRRACEQLSPSQAARSPRE